MRHLLHLNDTVFFCFVLSFWGGGWEKGYLFLNTEILHWHTIVRVFDQMNHVFSQLLASDLWIKMWKISICMKEKHHTIESVWAICIHSLQCIKDSLVFFFFFFLMHRNLWIKIIPAHFPWNNLFYPQIKSLYIL